MNFGRIVKRRIGARRKSTARELIMGTLGTLFGSHFRISAENRLIDDINLWMEFHKARNLTAHTYHAGIAEQAFQAAILLPEQGSLLIERLRKGND